MQEDRIFGRRTVLLIVEVRRQNPGTQGKLDHLHRVVGAGLAGDAGAVLVDGLGADAEHLASPNILDMLSMAGDYSLNELAPPKTFIGKSLVELNLRSKYNILVLGIKDVLTDEFILMPHADQKIKDSDLLLILGKAADVDKATQL